MRGAVILFLNIQLRGQSASKEAELTKVRWLLAGIFLVLVSMQACAPVAPGQKEEFGPQDLPTAKRLNKEAQLYYRQGKYTEAEPLFKRALAIREKGLGPEPPG